MERLTNWQKIDSKCVWYDRKARLDKNLLSRNGSSQPYWHLHPRMKTKWRRVKGRTDRGERVPSLSVHKMPRPSYEVDSVSLSTDPKVTESFWDYLNGRIDRLILWPSRKGYCSALHPFFHAPLHRASLLRSAAEKAGLAPPGCFYPSCLYTHLVRTLRNVDIEYWYT